MATKTNNGHVDLGAMLKTMIENAPKKRGNGGATWQSENVQCHVDEKGLLHFVVDPKQAIGQLTKKDGKPSNVITVGRTSYRSPYDHGDKVKDNNTGIVYGYEVKVWASPNDNA